MKPFHMLLFFPKARKNMTTQPFSFNEGIQTVIPTSDHRFLINEAGVLVYVASSDEEMEQHARADAQELQFAEILALVDHIRRIMRTLCKHKPCWSKPGVPLRMNYLMPLKRKHPEVHVRQQDKTSNNSCIPLAP